MTLTHDKNFYLLILEFGDSEQFLREPNRYQPKGSRTSVASVASVGRGLRPRF
jgi:hypothetical protein